MKLEKAIEIGEIELATCTHEEDPDWVMTLKLLIEAGKLIEQHPTIRFFLQDKLLPGETLE